MVSVYLATAYSFKSNTKWGKFFIRYSNKFPLSLIYRTMLKSRFKKITKITAKLMDKHYIVFSPITHSHPVGMLGTVATPLDHIFWLKQDKYWVDVCDVLMVYNGYPWKESYGVQREIEWAKQGNKFVYLIGDEGTILQTLHYPTVQKDDVETLTKEIQQMLASGNI